MQIMQTLTAYGVMRVTGDNGYVPILASDTLYLELFAAVQEAKASSFDDMPFSETEDTSRECFFVKSFEVRA